MFLDAVRRRTLPRHTHYNRIRDHIIYHLPAAEQAIEIRKQLHEYTSYYLPPVLLTKILQG